MQRKEITLPSGGRVIIRAPSMFDVMQAGEPPATLHRRARTNDARPLNEAELDWHVRSSKSVLLHCTGRIRWSDPERSARIVDKPFDECRADEMTVEDLSDADARAILDAVSTLREEAAAAAQTFPEAQPPAAHHAGHNGKTLPVPSDASPVAFGG